MKNIMLKQELLAILRNKKLLIPIIAVLFIPVMYSGMFLWAFWDPYDKLNDLPVAVVNEDTGAEMDGKKIALGEDLTDNLKEGKDFNYIFVDKEKGYKDLEKQKYYMLIEIPEDFSKNATTLMDKNPEKLELVYVPNEGYNFLSSQIGGTAIERIKAALSEKITETYAETMFDKVGEMADGVTKASEGAGKLSDGSIDLQNGSKELQSGLKTLAEKSIEFDNGMKKADAGVEELAAGSASLSDGLGKLQEGQNKLIDASSKLQTGTNQVSDGISKTKQGLETVQGKLPAAIEGTEKLGAGADKLSSSMQDWRKGAEGVSAGSQQLNTGLVDLKSKLNSMGLNEQQKAALNGALDQFIAGSGKLKAGTDQLSGAANQLSSGANELSTGIGSLQAGQLQLQQGINQLATGSAKLENGAAQLSSGQKEFYTGMQTFGEKLGEARTGSVKLADGASQLAGGLDQLSDGSTALTDGAGKLADGSEKLTDGTEKLSDGSKELADKLSEGAEKASEVDGNDKTYNMMANPVNVENEKINKVPNYGTGFAPYFLSLGLFVGALMMSIVFPVREPAAVPSSGLSWFTGKFAILAGVGVIQALLADAILLWGLGLEVQSLPLFILLTIVTSLTFITLIQFLVTTLGDAGRFVAIIILILQLTTSAGTFPLELVPDFLQGFNAFLPMTYSVQGFKEIISSTDFSFFWDNTIILVIYTLSFALITLTYFIVKHKRQFKTLTE